MHTRLRSGFAPGGCHSPTRKRTALLCAVKLLVRWLLLAAALVGSLIYSPCGVVIAVAAERLLGMQRMHGKLSLWKPDRHRPAKLAAGD